MGIFNKIINTLLNSTSTNVSKTSVSLSQPDRKIIEDSTRSMVHVINESLKIANESANYDTRISRTQVAKNTLSKLNEFAALYPDISITNLSDVERGIEAVENETRAMKPIIPVRPNIIPETAKEANQSHNEYLTGIMSAEDSVLSGAVYRVTLQLGTPLRALMLDGETCENGAPMFVGEPEYGYWSPVIKTWQELGIEGMKEFPESKSASNIGPVRYSEYLDFLKAVRSAVEPHNSIKTLIDGLRTVLREKKYAHFVRENHGQNKIIDYFFPNIISTIPGISSTVYTALCDLNIKTIGQLKTVTDKDLLAANGIGPAALIKIREFSDNYSGDLKATRADSVVR